MKPRRADFAGSWYPATAAACREEIERFVRESGPVRAGNRPPVGGIVPHAGWVFSGSVACNVIRRLAAGSPPDVFVVFGMHLPPHAPPHIMPEGEWETPLGPMSVDSELAAVVMKQFDFKEESTTRYSPDNTIELQLPFIKYAAGDSRLLPIGVPPSSQSEEIGRAVAAAGRELGRSIRVIGSTDLTHYGANYGYSPKGSGSAALEWVRKENDRRIIDAMIAMAPSDVLNQARIHQNACCSGAVAAAIAAARELGAVGATEVAYANSYEKSPGSSFVGYAGVVFETGN